LSHSVCSFLSYFSLSEYDALQTRHSTDVRKYEAEIHQLCQENARSVDGIRSDTEARLEALFRDRQQAWEDDKTTALQVLKQSYDEKLAGYRSRLEELGHDLEQERSNARSSQRQVEAERKQVAALEAELRASQDALAQCESQLAAERSNPELQRIIADKSETIRRLKQNFKRKDLEFDELMDVKILLDLEIKTYKQLLEQEEIRYEEARAEKLRQEGEAEAANTSSSSSMREERTASSSDYESETKQSRSARKGRKTVAKEVTESEEGTQQGEEQAASAAPAAAAEESTPAAEGGETEEDAPRKRRRTGGRKSTRGRGKSDEEPSAAPAESSRPKEAALLFSRVDASGEYVGMTNNSGKAAALAGWVLRAPRHGVEYRFDDSVRLNSGSTFYVTSSAGGVARADESRGDQVGQWPTSISWSQGDSVELVTPAGHVVAAVAVAPRMRGDSPMELEGEQAANTQASSDKGNCIVM
jgi:hypothetical protein